MGKSGQICSETFRPDQLDEMQSPQLVKKLQIERGEEDLLLSFSDCESVCSVSF
jgi:hypothetical protein